MTMKSSVLLHHHQMLVSLDVVERTSKDLLPAQDLVLRLVSHKTNCWCSIQISEQKEPKFVRNSTQRGIEKNCLIFVHDRAKHAAVLPSHAGTYLSSFPDKIKYISNRIDLISPGMKPIRKTIADR
jgi:hypothetical protein